MNIGDIASGLTGTARIWLINDMVHSWVDPVFFAGCLFALGWAVYRGIKWLIEHDTI